MVSRWRHTSHANSTSKCCPPDTAIDSTDHQALPHHVSMLRDVKVVDLINYTLLRT